MSAPCLHSPVICVTAQAQASRWVSANGGESKISPSIGWGKQGRTYGGAVAPPLFLLLKTVNHDNYSKTGKILHFAPPKFRSMSATGGKVTSSPPPPPPADPPKIFRCKIYILATKWQRHALAPPEFSKMSVPACPELDRKIPFWLQQKQPGSLAPAPHPLVAGRG